MKNNIKKMWLLSMILMCSLFWCNLPVYATEAGDGQVTRDGKIMFYEETSETSTPIKDSSSSSSPKSTSESEQVKEKPRGRLPQTGEILFRYGWIGLIIIFVLVLLRKYRKEMHQ